MNVLITGGAGFIGSHFVNYFVQKYKQKNIINLDKLSYAGNLKNIEQLNKKKNYNFIQGDICNKKLINKIIQKYHITHIINFAAETHVDRSIKNATPFIRNNITGVQILLDACLQHKIQRFLQISTDEVYGSCNTNAFDENTKLNPGNPYSASKAAADLLTLAYHNTYKLDGVITRSSNNYGPRQYPEKLLPLFIKNLLHNKKIPLYGKGENIRDWLYVKDNCKGIDLVFQKGKSGEIYNIAGGNEKTNIEISKLLLKELNKSENNIQYVKDRPGHDFRYSISTKKIRKELGWTPETPLKKGLKETIEWYKNNT